jgi:hypothetical protein
MKTKTKTTKVPKTDLYVDILDDDPLDSFRTEYIYLFSEKHGQPLEQNVLVTDEVLKFIDFASNHKKAVLFCDPGALGFSKRYEEVNEEYEEDILISNWLKSHESRILNIPWLISPDHYIYRTFEMKHQVNFFGSEYHWNIDNILYEWLFNNNPLALFVDGFVSCVAQDEYLKKLKEPVLTKVCNKFGLTGRTIKERKQAIENYYLRLRT